MGFCILTYVTCYSYAIRSLSIFQCRLRSVLIIVWVVGLKSVQVQSDSKKESTGYH